MVREKEPKAQHVSDFVETGVSAMEKPRKERTLQDVLKEEQDALVYKLDMLQAQRMIAEREKAIVELKGGTSPTGEAVVPSASQDKIKADMIAGLMTALAAQGKNPQEVADYLKALTPDVLTATFTATQVNPMMAALVSSMLREGRTVQTSTLRISSYTGSLCPRSLS